MRADPLRASCRSSETCWSAVLRTPRLPQSLVEAYGRVGDNALGPTARGRIVTACVPQAHEEEGRS
jgi:hypothetical protein